MIRSLGQVQHIIPNKVDLETENLNRMRSIIKEAAKLVNG